MIRSAGAQGSFRHLAPSETLEFEQLMLKIDQGPCENPLKSAQIRLFHHSLMD